MVYKIKGRALVHSDKGAVIVEGDDVCPSVVAKLKQGIDELIEKGGVWKPPVLGLSEKGTKVRWEPFTSNTKLVTILTVDSVDVAQQAMVQLANTGLWYDLKMVPYLSK